MNKTKFILWAVDIFLLLMAIGHLFVTKTRCTLEYFITSLPSKTDNLLIYQCNNSTQIMTGILILISIISFFIFRQSKKRESEN